MDQEYFSSAVKYRLAKFLGWPDQGRSARLFQAMVHAATWKNRTAILAEAEKQSHERPGASDAMRDATLLAFQNKYSGANGLRILIHAPSEQESPGGYSHAHNFQEAFSFMGIPTSIFSSGQSFDVAAREFKPSVFLTVDSGIYLRAIDWPGLQKYKKGSGMVLGLVAQPKEWGVRMPERIQWAKEMGVSFYYCFHDEEYIASDPMYRPILDAGYRIFSLMFGANILKYYPVNSTKKDLDYAFLASINNSKSERYLGYLGPIVRKYPGFINGPGWKKISSFSFKRDLDRYIYARAKIGINIHLPEQILHANETNERTFMLAACGIPQVTDAAKILSKLYSEKALFVADSPKKYLRFFESILAHPEIGETAAALALKETLEKHTTFHRAEDFFEKLSKAGIIRL